MMYRIILSIEFLEVLLEFHGHLFICVCGWGACVYGMICVQVQSMLAMNVLEELHSKMFENTFVVFW